MVLESASPMRFNARIPLAPAEGAPSDLAWRVIGLVNIYRLLVAGGLFAAAQFETLREVLRIEQTAALAIISAAYFFIGIGQVDDIGILIGAMRLFESAAPESVVSELKEEIKRKRDDTSIYS